MRLAAALPLASYLDFSVRDRERKGRSEGKERAKREKGKGNGGKGKESGPTAEKSCLRASI